VILDAKWTWEDAEVKWEQVHIWFEVKSKFVDWCELDLRNCAWKQSLESKAIIKEVERCAQFLWK